MRTPEIETNLFRYNIAVKDTGGEDIFKSPIIWTCPKEASPEAIFKITLPVSDFPDGAVNVHISAAQRGVLDNWYRDGGFIAAVERVAVSCRHNK